MVHIRNLSQVYVCSSTQKKMSADEAVKQLVSQDWKMAEGGKYVQKVMVDTWDERILERLEKVKKTEEIKIKFTRAKNHRSARKAGDRNKYYKTIIQLQHV